MARSVEENIFTMTGMIFCWYSSVERNFPTWQRTRQRHTEEVREKTFTHFLDFSIWEYWDTTGHLHQIEFDHVQLPIV